MTKIATTSKKDSELLNGEGNWEDKTSYKADVTIRFNKPTTVDALGIKAGAGLSNQNPHYIHA